MTTDAGVLMLAQWLSPAYPVGAFAYSHGVETLIATGQIHDAASLQDALGAMLTDGVGLSDAVFLAEAHRGTIELARLDAIARAFCASAERLDETVQQGAAFCATTRAVWGLDLPELTYPVAVGRAAALQGLALQPTCALYLQAIFGNLVMAAVRLVPLGQTDGQRVLAALSGDCATLAARADALTLEDLSNICFVGDVAAMHHETLQPRIFRT